MQKAKKFLLKVSFNCINKFKSVKNRNTWLNWVTGLKFWNIFNCAKFSREMKGDNKWKIITGLIRK